MIVTYDQTDNKIR